MIQGKLRQHLPPIAVTSIGLLVAAVLAFIPVMLREDTTSAGVVNAAAISELTGQLELLSSDMNTRIAALESTVNSRLKDLEIQVITLNKGITRQSLKLNRLAKSDEQAREQGTTAEVLTALASSEQAATARIDTLEKAVTRLHHRYLNNSAQESVAEEVVALGKSERSTTARIDTLEKAVTRLHQRHLNNADQVQIIVAEAVNALGETENSTTARINTLEKAVSRLHRLYVISSDQMHERNAELGKLLEVRKKLAALLQSLAQE